MSRLDVMTLLTVPVEVDLVPDVEKDEVCLIRAEEEVFNIEREGGRRILCGGLTVKMRGIPSGLNSQQICDSGGFPGRTVEAVNEQLERCRFVVARQKAFVETIEPSEDALSIEEIVKLFSTEFEQICGLQEVDKLVLERFRIIFQAAKDYGPLLAHYEKWEKIEGQIEELAAAVAELPAAKGTGKA